MKKLSITFAILALITSHIMCAVIAYNYRNMLCAEEHLYTSTPAEITFLLVIPFGIIITIFTILSIVFHKKSKK